MPELPRGTVTFLFTDVAGSTGLWQAHPDAMQAVYGWHDALLRGAAEERGGVVYKTIGAPKSPRCFGSHRLEHRGRARPPALVALAWPARRRTLRALRANGRTILLASRPFSTRCSLVRRDGSC